MPSFRSLPLPSFTSTSKPLLVLILATLVSGCGASVATTGSHTSGPATKASTPPSSVITITTHSVSGTVSLNLSVASQASTSIPAKTLHSLQTELHSVNTLMQQLGHP